MNSLIDEFRILFYLVGPNELQGTEPKFVDRSVPLFFISFLLEYTVACLRGNYKSYEYKDTIASVSSGIAQQLFMLAFRDYLEYPFLLIYEYFRITTFDSTTWTTWICLMLGCDVAYYWFHRLAHSWHIMWAGHSVHHSGQLYNLATSLRQGMIQGLFSWVMYLPLAFLGFHPRQYMSHKQLNLVYQFWVHSEQIGYLGPLELILNTPSHHRMHHRPPGNCNYAGFLIIWDRMFGTFKAEDQQINSYGLAKPLESYDPIWMNIEHWTRMANINGSWLNKIFSMRVKHANVFKPSKLLSLDAKHKGSLWKPDDGTANVMRVKRYDGPGVDGNGTLPLPLMAHTFVHFLIILGLSYMTMVMQNRLEMKVMLPIVVYSLWSLSSISGLNDKPSRSRVIAESIRLLIFQIFFVMNPSLIYQQLNDIELKNLIIENIPANNERLMVAFFFATLWMFACQSAAPTKVLEKLDVNNKMKNKVN